MIPFLSTKWFKDVISFLKKKNKKKAEGAPAVLNCLLPMWLSDFLSFSDPP